MVIGEGGGFDLPLKDHLWTADLTMPEKVDRAGDLSRETVISTNEFDERYNLWVDNLSILRDYGLNAIVYTQISDVENEVNGWLTYDRKISKIPEARLAEIHSKLFKPTTGKGQFTIPLSMNVPQKWMYSFTEPSADWYKKGSQGNWNGGNGPFGKTQMNIPEVNTNWDTRSLYLQKDFNLTSLPSKPSIVTYNIGIINVYINGEPAIQINNLSSTDAELKVSEVPLPDKAVRLFIKGNNHLAVKYDFSRSIQPFNYFDIGLKEYR
jgi:hypothetical protein